MAKVKFKRSLSANYASESNENGKLYFAKDGIFVGTGVGNDAYPVATSRSYVDELLKGIGSEILAGAIAFEEGTLTFSSLNQKLFTADEIDAIEATTNFYDLPKAATIKAGYTFRVVNAGTIKVKDATEESYADIKLEPGDIVLFTNTIEKSTTAVVTKNEVIAIQGNVSIFDGGAAGLVPTAPTEGKSGKYLAGDGSWKTIDVNYPVTDVKVNNESVVSNNGVAAITFGEGLVVEKTSGSTEANVSVATGNGLTIDSNDQVAVATGDGISTDNSGKIKVNKGDGLVTDSQGAINVNLDKSTLNFNTDGQLVVASNAGLSNGQLATASSTVKGGVKVNGAGLRMEDQTIQIKQGDGVTLADGSLSAKTDNSTIGFDTNGSLQVKSTASLSNGQLATASSSTKGAIKVNGSGLAMSGDTLTANVDDVTIGFVDGKLTVQDGANLGNSKLAAASSNVRGGVKIGSGVSVTADGTISVPIDSSLSSSSTNPVQNQVVNSAISTINSSISSLSTRVTNVESALTWE